MCAVHDEPFRLWNLDDASNGGPAGAEYRAQIEREIELRVGELRRRENTSFMFIWNVAGSDAAHCETSDDLGGEDIRDQLTDLFTSAVEDCFGRGKQRNATDSVESGFDLDSAYEEVDDEWDEGEFEAIE